MLEQQILKEALTLASKNRASLVEKLLVSLDQPDKSIDELCAKEAENRIDAYEAGNIKAISAEQVFDSNFSISSAMRGIENEGSNYSLTDLK
ncbi:MAG: addiction module protein [Methylobacter sp.]|nr:addiction module protein [Methylobacter sp.]